MVLGRDSCSAIDVDVGFQLLALLNFQEKATVSQARKDLQKKVDEALLSSIESVPLLKEYLAAKFTLRSGQKPHEMKF